jgi:Protein of unknown function (DUF3119)
MKIPTILMALAVGATNAFVPVRGPKQARIHNLLQGRSDAVVSPPRLVALHAFDFFKRFSGDTGVAQAPPPPQKPQYDNVTIDPDFRVAGLFLAIGIVLDQIPYIQWTLGLFTTLLGVLFLVQTFRIRFVFDEDNCLELKTTSFGSDSIEDAGENIIVGGANRWACDKIVNYDFFPKGWIDDNPVGPILVYFKETQTPEETWNEGPGKSANDPEKIAAGKAVAGQVHFFPTVCNAQQIRAEFEKRGCQKIDD